MAYAPIDRTIRRRRKRDPKGTRERLVRAALELFTTQGYHASTTTQIATRAGIAEGTIYRHFQTKEHLLNEIYRAAVRLLTKPLRDCPPDRSCRDQLRRVALAWRETALADPALIRLVFGSDIEDHLDVRSRDAYADFRSELEQLIAYGKSAGEIRTGSVELWTDVWLKLVVLILERTASGDWLLRHSAPDLVLDSAWEAIRQPISVQTPS